MISGGENAGLAAEVDGKLMNVQVVKLYSHVANTRETVSISDAGVWERVDVDLRSAVPSRPRDDTVGLSSSAVDYNRIKIIHNLPD